MIVRIRLKKVSPLRILASGIRRTAVFCAALLTPAAVAAWALGGWRILADMQWVNEFAIRDGLLSHWQVWLAIGIVIQFIAVMVGRVAGGEDSGNQPASAPLQHRARAGGR